LGSNKFRETARQADPKVNYLKHVAINTESNEIFITFLLCKCSKKLIEDSNNGYHCEHCDKPCYANPKVCKYCIKLMDFTE
jgi:hypothetical protein